VNRVALAAYKAVLLAYPSTFRRAYGDAMVQSLLDRHRHDGMALVPLIVTEVVDAARVAPRMRWESPMNRIVILITGATVAVAVALAISPLALIPIAGAVFVAGLWWSRQGQPIRPTTSRQRRGLGLLIGGAAMVGVAIAIPAIDGGELDELWWTIFVLSLLGGIAMMVIGLIQTLGNQTTPTPATTR
jgi:hypothetical protein